MRSASLALPALPLLLALAGCGGAQDAASGGTSTDTEATTAAAETADVVGTDAHAEGHPHPPALEPSHLDPLARGIAAENAHLAQAVRQLQAAESDGDQLHALTEIDAVRLDAIGARAAGLEAHEYRRLRDALYEQLGAVEMRTALEAQYGAVDTSGMDDATAAEARRQAAEVMAALPDPYADLQPDLAEALRARQSELAALRAAHIGLLFEAVDG